MVETGLQTSRVERYLATLPEGIDSHPQCETKASIMRSAIDGQDLRAIAALLPEPVAAIVLEPPPAGVWIPAVWSDAIFHAVCEVAYPTEAAMLKWTYDRAKRMARNPLYRGIMKVVGPSRLFRIGPKAHGLMQRGTELRNTVEPDRVISRVSYPHGLHDHWNSLSNVPVLRALAELTGGRAVRSRMLDHGDLHTTYECSWLED